MMNKEELGKRISDFLRDDDKELAYSIFVDIREFIGEFGQNDISLKAKYDGLFCSPFYSTNECYFMFQNRKLSFKLEDRKIIIIQSNEENHSGYLVDEIAVDNRIAICKHGKFEIRMIDKYLIECFAELVN